MNPLWRIESVRLQLGPLSLILVRSTAKMIFIIYAYNLPLLKVKKKKLENSTFVQDVLSIFKSNHTTKTLQDFL